jgi:hypothetical protein
MAIQNYGNIDGDKLEVDYVPSSYTREIASSYSDNVAQVSSHLKGIDEKIGSMDIWLETPITAASIMAAHDTLPTGGTIHILAGTHSISYDTIILSNNSITLNLSPGCILNDIDGTHNLIKITGNNCKITGGTIQVPDIAGFTSSEDMVNKLRAATIWNTGDNTIIDGVIFQNSYIFTIFNDGGSYVQVKNCRVLSGWDDLVFNSSNPSLVNSSYYQDGGHYNRIINNYFENGLQAVCSGSYINGAGNYLTVEGNTFYHVGNHPVYIADAQIGASICFNAHYSCGSSFAITGTESKCNYNHCHVDYSLFETTPEVYPQSGLGLRNSAKCQVIGNTITGRSGQVVLSVDNVDSGTSLSDILIESNTIHMTSGTALSAIRVGGSLTTSVYRIDIKNNKITGVVPSSMAVLSGLIRLASIVADTTLDCAITGNQVKCENASCGIRIVFGKFCNIANNKITNNTNYSSATTLYGIVLEESCYCEVAGNMFSNTVDDSELTLLNFYESGTNVQVYKNRFINNVFIPTITARYTNSTLISGNNSTADTTNIIWT